MPKSKTSLILHLDDCFSYAFRMQMTLKDFDKRFNIHHEPSLQMGEFRVSRNSYDLILLSDRLADIRDWDLAATRLGSICDTAILLLSDEKRLPNPRKSSVKTVFRKSLIAGSNGEEIRQWQKFQTYLVHSLAQKAA